MKKIFFSIVLFAALVTQGFAQKYNYEVIVKRGDYKEFVFKQTGDVTATYLTFVVKLTKGFTSPRLIEKKNVLAGGSANEITATYTAPNTTITVKLLPEDTQDFTAKTYFYDITSTLTTDSTRITTLYDGPFACPYDVQTPFDGTAFANDGTRITTVSLANATSLYSTIVWDTTGKYYYPISLNDFKTLLNITVGGSVSNADSLGSKPASDYVTKSDTTNQRTFSDLKYSPKDQATFTTDIRLPSNIYIGNNPYTLLAPSVGELNYVDGVTSAIQTQLNNKQNAMGTDDNYVTDAEKTVIGNTSGTNTGDNATNSQYSGLAASKQDALVSGTNIKTINSQSILGSGNIVVAASDSGDTLTYTARELDSLAALAGTALQSSSSINPGNITQSTSYRLVTDTEKSTWNAKLGTTDIQLFVDSVYRSNDTIYFKQKDGTRLFFVDQNTGGEGDTIPYTVHQIDSLLLLAGTSLQPGDAISDTTFTYQVLDSLGTRITELEGLLNSIIAAVEGCCDLTDNDPPAAASSYTAIGGTSETQYVATWTDPTTFDLDSLRWYEGSSADTATWTWYASINEGVQTYTRTGRSAGTTYWSGVRAIDDSGNVGYFSNIDSATTLSAPGGSFQMETQRFIDAITTPLASGTETAIDSFVVMLKDTFALDSLSQMFNAIYLHAIETEEASKFNLVKRSHDITESGTDLLWTANEGWRGDYDGGNVVGTGYLDCNYNFATDTNSIAGRLSIGITTYVRNSDSTDGPWNNQPIYSVNEGAVGTISLNMRRDDNTGIIRLNDETWSATFSNTSPYVGVYTLDRNGNTRTVYKNSASLFSETQATTGIPNLELWLLRSNTDGVVAGRSSPKQISITMVHRGLTSLAEHQSLRNILEWWMDRWNKGVL